MMALFVGLTTSGAWAQSPPAPQELPNFHKVNERLYRGAQPQANGLQKLAELGIKTVVSLRLPGDETRREEAEATALGLRYFNVDMAGWGRPSIEEVAAVLEILDAPENQPVFVHCRRGADRTGTILACYRIVNDGWTAKQARAEAAELGMHWTQYWMRDFISDFARYKERHGALVKNARLNGGSLDNHAGTVVRLAETNARKGQAALRWLREKL